MQVRGPPVLSCNRAHISDQSVKPNVENVFFFVWNRDPPLNVGAAYGEVGQAAFNKCQNFVAPAFGQDKIRLLLVKVQQLLLKRRKLKVVILFGDSLGRPAAFGTRIAW